MLFGQVPPDGVSNVIESVNHWLVQLAALIGTATFVIGTVITAYFKLKALIADLKKKLAANTEICVSQGKALEEVQKSVNGHTEKLMEATSRAAKAEGKAEGKMEGKAEAMDALAPSKVVVEAARVAAEVVVKSIQSPSPVVEEKP